MDAMIKHMKHLVYDEHVPFCYLDFKNFEVDCREYKMAHGTFRNNISRLMKDKVAEVSFKSNLTFYSLKGVKFGRASKMAMTRNHTGVACSPSHPLYRLIRDLPLGTRSIHDIHLKFKSPRIHATISLAHFNNTLVYHHTLLDNSKDIQLLGWIVEDLIIKVAIHRTDTVSIVLGCSLDPVLLDVNGIIRLTSALSSVRERLSEVVEGRIGARDFENKNLLSNVYERAGVIPHYSQWIVTMWHFGADASIEYSGDRFSATWETTENAILRAYSKAMKDGRTGIRIDRQEYPKVTLADAIEQKLSGVGF
jgi:hypothetical protein